MCAVINIKITLNQEHTGGRGRGLCYQWSECVCLVSASYIYIIVGESETAFTN